MVTTALRTDALLVYIVVPALIRARTKASHTGGMLSPKCELVSLTSIPRHIVYIDYTEQVTLRGLCQVLLMSGLPSTTWLYVQERGL